MKTLALATAISAPVLLGGCGKSHDSQVTSESDQPVASTDQKGTCPMHADVIGKVGDTCPKCGMKLELMDEEKASNQNEYYMDFKASSELRAGQANTLSFTPLIKGKSESVALDLQHDKKIHLIIVSKDLSYFDHVHPEFQSDGSYRVRVLPNGGVFTMGKFHDETFFAKGGEYVLFADYLPHGGSHQVERIELRVNGDTAQPVKYTTEKLVSQADGYEVSLLTDGGKFFNEGMTHMTAVVKKNGAEVNPGDFEDFLAAKAHVVMIGENTHDYLHVHPEIVDGRLSLHTTFGTPGIFRGWLQFQTGGTVHTADFVINVAEGKSPQHREQKHTHKH